MAARKAPSLVAKAEIFFPALVRHKHWKNLNINQTVATVNKAFEFDANVLNLNLIVFIEYTQKFHRGISSNLSPHYYSELLT